VNETEIRQIQPEREIKEKFQLALQAKNLKYCKDEEGRIFTTLPDTDEVFVYLPSTERIYPVAPTRQNQYLRVLEGEE